MLSKYNTKKYIYIYIQKKDKIIDEIRLLQYINGISKCNKLFDNTPNQSYNIRTKNGVQINDTSCGSL